MPSILKNCVVAIAGDLDDSDWRDEKVRQWVKYQEGKFSDVVDETVTHLLCTEDNYKRKISPVKFALKNKAIKIVLKDWLEDSINKKSCLKTLEYQLDAKEQKEIAKKRKLEQAQKYSSDAKLYVDERFWRPYHDSTFFKYQISLTRVDEDTGDIREKILLTLWESIQKPRLYTCTVQYTKSNKTLKGRLFESPVHLEQALRKFKHYFKGKTGIAWNDRIEKAGTTGPEEFQYQPPTGGKPVGLLSKRRACTSVEAAQVSNNHVTQKAEALEVDRERAKEKHIGHTANKPDDAERPAKRPRCKEPETIRAHSESKGVSTGSEQTTHVASWPGDDDQSDQGNDGQQSIDTPSNDISQSNQGDKQEENEDNSAQGSFSAHRDAILHFLATEDKEPELQGDANYPTPCRTPQYTENGYPEVDDEYHRRDSVTAGSADAALPGSGAECNAYPGTTTL